MAELNLKDALVTLPASVSGMALAWDAGTFDPLGVGSYSLFTITEHLGFALSEIPQALLMIFLFSLMALLYVYTGTISIFAEAESDGKRTVKWKRLWIIGSLIVAVVIAGVSTRTRDMSGIFLGAFIIVGGMVACAPPMNVSRKPGTLIFASIVAMLLFSFSLGVDSTYKTLKGQPVLTKVEFGPISRDMVVFRTGERGILGSGPNSRIPLAA
ncbi:hypothetical protein ONR75_10360 [Rhodopseudomonas sp. P2A-2r]|uniref:hypothetical protein n=1 Tax=Rhodopseudomonas sp. P2A-2r TaxID=2991972 RepID=UPI002234020E|nr:hypothetical protein [Rhodopseudomonas sp. P2A-2r]UZE50981.1 hypothetical protein ONR75_10360 [Rhodopseudomonas sp. P2A-2r]